MTWRVAKSLDHLLGQWNAAHPGRSKASDGAKGDAAHAGRESDHNPWVKDGAVGVVTARDFTHDPAHGADFGKLAEAIRSSQDPRVKYVIYNRRIFRSYDKRITNGVIRAWQWTNYTGPNAHTKHGHVSVIPDKRWYDDTRNWTLKMTLPPPKDDEMTPEQYREMMKFLVTISGNLAVLMARELTDDAEKNRAIAELKVLMKDAALR